MNWTKEECLIFMERAKDEMRLHEYRGNDEIVRLWWNSHNYWTGEFNKIVEKEKAEGLRQFF